MTTIIRQRLRKSTVAKLEDCCPRTVDRKVETKRLPKPHYDPGSPIPYWYADEIEAHRKLATVERPASSNNSDSENSAA
jgi:hypothetical protein